MQFKSYNNINSFLLQLQDVQKLIGCVDVFLFIQQTEYLLPDQLSYTGLRLYYESHHRFLFDLYLKRLLQRFQTKYHAFEIKDGFFFIPFKF